MDIIGEKLHVDHLGFNGLKNASMQLHDIQDAVECK